MNTIDTQLFLWLNAQHSSSMDVVMAIVTNKLTWIPLYVAMIGLLWLRFKKQSLYIIGLLLLCILFSDQICSGLLKPWVARLRPCHEPSIASLVHLVGGCGGSFGFCSSHAANSFTLATALWLLFGKTYQWISTLFVWAFVVSYSRIYVGVHYPFDVLAGAIIGSGVAWLLVMYFKRSKFYLHLV